MEIRGKSISFSTYKKKKTFEREQQLEREILELEQNLTDQLINELEEKKREVEEIKNIKFKGQCIRSKVKWIEEGEKPSKYFVSLESRNYVSKQIPKIEKDNGSIDSSQSEILNETKAFYENLYKKRENVDTENIHDRLKEGYGNNEQYSFSTSIKQIYKIRAEQTRTSETSEVGSGAMEE